jgi:hypothetical protein
MLVKARGILVVLALVVALSALAGGTALARGGGGGGGKSSATIAVSPNPATQNSLVVISGCGYSPSAPAELGWNTPTAATVSTITIDSTGCFSTSTYVYGAGTYTANGMQYLRGRWVTLATTSVLVT